MEINQNKFYIYHIPGIKIGCSVDADIRVKTQGYTEYYILEEHTDIYKASDRELKLQKKFGYVVDKIPYYISIQHFNKAKQKINYSELGNKLSDWQKETNYFQTNNFLEGAKEGGKTQGLENVKNGHMERMRNKSNFNRKSIKAFNRFTGQLVGIYNSLTECCNELDLGISKVSSTLAGRRKYHKNYTFQWNYE